MIFFENNRYRYQRTWLLRRHYVLDKATGLRALATDEELRKLGAVFQAARRVPWGRHTTQQMAESKIYLAFCMTVHGVEEAWGVFMTQEPTMVAMTFGSMPTG